jgi:hypothetical protein
VYFQTSGALGVCCMIRCISRPRGLWVCAVIRDDQGVFPAASCCRIPNIGDAASAEARALPNRFIFAVNIRCTKLEISSDCEEVINLMLDEGNSVGPAAAIYEECSQMQQSRGMFFVS